MSESWWEAAEPGVLSQGMLVRGCNVPFLPEDFDQDGGTVNAIVKEYDVIVASQSCDLTEARGATHVCVCPYFTVSDLEARDKAMSSKWKDAAKGRINHLLLLQCPTDTTSRNGVLVVTFKEVYSLPIGYVRRRAKATEPNLRLRAPYREHFSGALGRFFARVALQAALPEF